MQPVRKTIRLPLDRYTERGRAFSITIAVRHRRPVFGDHDFGLRCIDYLGGLRSITGHAVYAYCLMPDHVHLLLVSRSRESLVVFVGRWKSLCAYDWKRHTAEPSFWQRSFFDHALTRKDDVRHTVEHILLNPVRAGLVERPGDYPLSGSLEV